MRFSKEHFEELKEAVRSKEIDVQATKQNYKEKGLSETRLLWDLFWASGYNMNPNFRESDYTDKNIETAMKKVVRDLTAIQVPNC